jgi:hypothetical protein
MRHYMYIVAQKAGSTLPFHLKNNGYLLTSNVLHLNEKQVQPCQASGAGRAQEMKTLSLPLDAQTHPVQPIPLHQLQMPSSTNNKVCFVLWFFLNFRGLGL